MTKGNRWSVEFYEDASGKRPVEKWMDGLRDAEYLALRAAITKVLEHDGLDLASTAWLKALGDGLFEFRVRHDAPTIEALHSAGRAETPKASARILLRLFVHFHGNRIILMLHGYDKGKDNSAKRQNAEIQEARKRLRAWKLAEASNKKR
ncbi:MAG: hypothetical protein ACSLEW_04820 [Nocardioides sp.]